MRAGREVNDAGVRGLVSKARGLQRAIDEAIGRIGGRLRIGPYGPTGGLIVETTGQTETGWLSVHYCLVAGK